MISTRCPLFRISADRGSRALDRLTRTLYALDRQFKSYGTLKHNETQRSRPAYGRNDLIPWHSW
jgi:hypothetical protein